MASSNLLWNFAGHLGFRVRNLVISPQKDLAVASGVWVRTTQVRAVVTSWQVVFSLSLSPRHPKILLEVERHHTLLFTPLLGEAKFWRKMLTVIFTFLANMQYEASVVSKCVFFAWHRDFLQIVTQATRKNIFLSQPDSSSVKDNFLVPSGITAQARSVVMFFSSLLFTISTKHYFFRHLPRSPLSASLSLIN